MRKLINRDGHIQKISPYIDLNLIKVIVGIRECGKSSILHLLTKEFLKKAVKESNILYYSMEDLKNNKFKMDFIKFHNHIIESTNDDENYYLFIDEVQSMGGWEDAIASLLSKGNIDIYVTGSNAQILSSELSTRITGRTISFGMETLSFLEFIDFRKELGEEVDVKKLFEKYLRFGGFPIVSSEKLSITEVDNINKEILNTILYFDTLVRNSVRNEKTFIIFMKFMMNNIGNTFSARKIKNAFQNEGHTTSLETILNYISFLEKTYILRKVGRYDIKGRKILASEEKYYTSDVSLIYATEGFKEHMISAIEENMVYLELVRRGYEVYIGKTKSNKEIDFIGIKDDRKIYIQVTHTIENEKTANRELSALKDILDNYPKYLIVGNKPLNGDLNGIIQMKIEDFLIYDGY